MTAYEIPPPQIDLRLLPPPLLTSEPGSFANNTLAARLPRIALDLIESNEFPPGVVARLDELRAELVGGRVRELEEETQDKWFWNEISREYIGRSWLDVPWYWAEAYFYRRVLQATGYFQPGPMHLVDPYRSAKAAELAPEVAPRTAAATLRDLPSDPRKRFEILLYSSLWGNRVDLSYKVALEAGRTLRLEEERRNLLVDDTARLWEGLSNRRVRRLALIADNAGTELTMDLVLVDAILEGDFAGEVTIHLKQQPYFVSDAMPGDVEAALEAMAKGGIETKGLAGRILGYRNAARLKLHTHWFYDTPLFYFQLPPDLHAHLSGTDLVILKGDVNYRRLLGDAHWEPTTPFVRATEYFPTSLAALRTLKAELIVGLAPGEAGRLSALDPQWMVNGRRGIVQVRF